MKLLKFFYFGVFIGLISNTVCADELASADIYSKIIRANGLHQTLILSTVLIDHEIAALPNKKLKLSKKDIGDIKQQLLARYHPSTLENLLLDKLKTTDITSSRKLLEFYESALAKKIHDSRIQSLQIEHQSELLEYQKKLESLPAQIHRKKLILIIDRLNRQSDWNAALLFNIQQSIYLLLPENKRNNYLFSNEETLLNELTTFNSIINMYSLKHISSEQLILYLDELNENKPNLEVIDTAFRQLLQEQQALQLTLEQ